MREAHRDANKHREAITRYTANMETIREIIAHEVSKKERNPILLTISLINSLAENSATGYASE